MATGRKASGEWVHFPYNNGKFTYTTAGLKKAWPRLHAGDREPWPDAKRVAALLQSRGARELVDAAAADAAIAAGVQAAWCAFHAGDFRAAWEQGSRLGPPGIAAAVKAAGVHASALETNGARAEQRLLEAVALSERAAAAAPFHANAHYFHAFVLGRYSQRISVLKALAAGHAARIRQSLEQALDLEPDHADAHLALGLYHAEVVAKVGGIAARITYGATAEAAERHFERALHLSPDAPVAALEYANGLVSMRGSRARTRAVELLRRAIEAEPADAMERLDVDRAVRALAALGG
jgi:tetratricopeptide (TPR) repeat protein